MHTHQFLPASLKKVVDRFCAMSLVISFILPHKNEYTNLTGDISIKYGTPDDGLEMNVGSKFYREDLKGFNVILDSGIEWKGWIFILFPRSFLQILKFS